MPSSATLTATPATLRAYQAIVGTASVTSAPARLAASGAPLPATNRLATIFCRGTDISAQVKIGIRRGMQLTGGSKASCEFALTSAKGSFRPAVGDEVVIYEGAVRFFAGFVDTISEFDYTGSAGIYEIKVQCVDYGAICDRRVIGWKFEVPWGGLASILMGQIAMKKLADLGVTYVPSTGEAYLGAQTFNWLTVTEAYNQIANGANAAWRIDFFRNLYLIDLSAGYRTAPFSLTDNDGNWAEMTVQRTARARANRVGLRNSRDLVTTWTDTFTGDGTRVVFFPMAQLVAAPAVTVNGVEQSVAPKGDFQGIYDWYWSENGYGVWQNLSNPVLTSGDTISITYPSPLSYVQWEQDDADIAANGLWESVEEVRDVPDIDSLEILAEARVEERKPVPITISFRTDKAGLEPGMAITVNTTRPPVNATLLIQSVTSEEQGKSFFRHQVTASTAALPDLQAMYQRLVTKTKQALNRVVTPYDDGLTPQLPNDDTLYLDGKGNWTNPAGSGSGTSYPYAEVPAGVIDGTNKSFALSKNPDPPGMLLLALNGVLQRFFGTVPDFTLVGNLITYKEAPVDGDWHEARYWYRSGPLARYFPGGTDGIDWGNSSAFHVTGDLSIGMWVKLNASSAGGVLVYMGHNTDGSPDHNDLYNVHVSGSSGAWGITYAHEASPTAIASFAASLPNDAWRYIGISRDTATKRVALWAGDGVKLTLIGTQSYAVNPSGGGSTDLHLMIGRQHPNSGYPPEGQYALNGTIQEHYIWSRSLTEAEHKAAMQGTPSMVNIVLGCRMGNTPEVDMAGNGVSIITGTDLVGGH